MEYIVLQLNSDDYDSGTIVAYIKQGYKLHGGAFSHDGYICQAMIKEDDE